MYQQISIIGNVGRDADLTYTPQGIAVAKFSVAVNKVTGKGDTRKEKATWFRVTVWRERAEVASKYIKKGMRLFVVGEIAVSAYVAKDGQPSATLELTAHEFKFLDRVKSDEDENSENEQETPQMSPEDRRLLNKVNEAADETDLPF